VERFGHVEQIGDAIGEIERLPGAAVGVPVDGYREGHGSSPLQMTAIGGAFESIDAIRPEERERSY
jgi:hypothetical protein